MNGALLNKPQFIGQRHEPRFTQASVRTLTYPPPRDSKRGAGESSMALFGQSVRIKRQTIFSEMACHVGVGYPEKYPSPNSLKNDASLSYIDGGGVSPVKH
jgi:hypothetical protein